MRNMNDSRTSSPPARGVWRSPVILDDLTADLIWPRLLKAGSLAVRPGRLALAFFYLVGLAAIVSVADRIDGVEGNVLLAAAAEWLRHFNDLLQACTRLNGAEVGQAVYGMFIGTLLELLSSHTILTIGFLPVILVWTTLMGGAISRIAAMDFAQGVGLSWPEGMGYAMGRWSSFAGSIFGPLLVVYGIVLALAVGGWVLFSLSGVNVVGGLLWPLFLIGGAVAAVIMLAMTLGGPMLVPAVACEGTDAIDAVQHAYSYVFAKPLRLLVYMAILAAEFLLISVVVAAVIWLIVNVAQQGAGMWVAVPADNVLRGQPELEGVDSVASGFVRFWTGIPLLLGVAFAVSYFWCAATVLYLAMRRVCDGQDITEVWVDTIVPGTMAERKQPIAAAKVSSPADAIVDNGPADAT